MADQENSSKGYGKRSFKQWLVIYIIVGAIIYGLIYLLLSSGSGSGY